MFINKRVEEESNKKESAERNVDKSTIKEHI
jgi:hypothetical protein